MQSEALSKITARYSRREDRIVIDGVIHNGDKLQLDFTQRMARAFVNELVTRLNNYYEDPLVQDFAQGEAIMSKSETEAVQVPGDQRPWLITHIHFQEIETITRIFFTEDDTRAVHLDCSETILRNLIDILYKSFELAEWDVNVFPGWAVGTATTIPDNISVN